MSEKVKNDDAESDMTQVPPGSPSNEKSPLGESEVKETNAGFTPLDGEKEKKGEEADGSSATGKETDAEAAEEIPFKSDWRFWMIMATLAFAILLASLESTVVITSLPSIVQDLKIGSDYIWISNVFFLTSAIVQPLFGQLSNLFGRKSVLMFIFAAYTLGSGLAGGATNTAGIIAGRAIQGIGSGGVNMASEVIVSDLVPLKSRGNYMAFLMIVATIGFSIGPIVGGAIVQSTTWRWVFYLNLPIGGIGFVFTYFFLNLKWNREEAMRAKLKRIDYVGNGLLAASTISILIALTWAGPVYAWSNARILAPLILGLLGLIVFVWYEGSGFPAEPVMPLRIFPNVTSKIIYFNTWSAQMLIYWCFFFFPLYFQAVRLSTPTRSGVQILPLMLIALPGGIAAATSVSRWGRYKWLHVIGFVLLSAGIGLLAVLGDNSSTAAWVLIQIVPALAVGILTSTQLPAFQATILESDQAVATGSWCFIRTFGMVWGVAIAGAIFNAYVSQNAHFITDAALRAKINGGDAYASATRDFLLTLDETSRKQVQKVFLLALRKVYLISLSFGGLSLILSFFVKEVALRTDLKTEFGLEERKKKKPSTTV